MVLFTIGVWVHPKVLMVRGSLSLKAARQYPKQLIEWPQGWLGMLAFQDGKLLTQGDVLKN